MANQSVVPVANVVVVVDGRQEEISGPLLPGEVSYFQAPTGASLLLAGTLVPLGDGPVGVYLAPGENEWIAAPLPPSVDTRRTLPWGSELSERFSTGSLAPERVRRLRFYPTTRGALPPKDAVGDAARVVEDPKAILRFTVALEQAHEGVGTVGGPPTRAGLVVAELEEDMLAWFRYAEGPGWLTVETPPLVNELGTHSRTVAALDATAWP